MDADAIPGGRADCADPVGNPVLLPLYIDAPGEDGASERVLACRSRADELERL